MTTTLLMRIAVFALASMGSASASAVSAASASESCERLFHGTTSSVAQEHAFDREKVVGELVQMKLKLDALHGSPNRSLLSSLYAEFRRALERAKEKGISRADVNQRIAEENSRAEEIRKRIAKENSRPLAERMDRPWGGRRDFELKDESNSSVLFHPMTNQLLTFQIDGKGEFVDIVTDRMAVKLDGLDDMFGVRFSGDGKRILTGLWGQEPLGLWDAASGKQIAKLTHAAVAENAVFSPDHTLLATADRRGKVWIWNAQTGDPLHGLPTPDGGLSVIAFTPGGDRIVTGSKSGALQVWDPKTGERISSHGVGANRMNKSPIPAAKQIDEIDISPAGDLLAIQTSDYTTLIWDIQKGEARSTIVSPGFYPVKVSFVAGGKIYLVHPVLSGVATLRATNPDREIAQLDTNENKISTIARSHDGSVIATVSGTSSVLLWNAQTGQKLQELEVEGQEFRRVFFSPDETQIVALGKGGHVSLWVQGRAGSGAVK